MDYTGKSEFNYCYNCMKHLETGQVICPVCGHDNSVIQNPDNALPEGTLLDGKYLIGIVLGQGGFGITYLGFDVTLMVVVAIKEYFPVGVGTRSSNSLRVVSIGTRSGDEGFQKGCEEFQAEAQILARFNSPNIVHVRDYFRENGTAYIVMDFVNGNSLKQELEICGGRIPWERVTELFKPLIQEIDRLHKNKLIHRDIKPDNLKFTYDEYGKEHLVLLDFGSARSFVSAQVTKNYTSIVTHGYSPLEQYSPKSRQGPYTDVYALCATMYHLITGEIPPSSTDRVAGDAELHSFSDFGLVVPETVENAIRHGLEVKGMDRPQTMKILYAEITGKVVHKTEHRDNGQQKFSDQTEQKDKKRPASVIKPSDKDEDYNHNKSIAWVIPILLALFFGGCYLVYRSVRQNSLNSSLMLTETFIAYDHETKTVIAQASQTQAAIDAANTGTALVLESERIVNTQTPTPVPATATTASTATMTPIPPTPSPTMTLVETLSEIVTPMELQIVSDNGMVNQTNDVGVLLRDAPSRYGNVLRSVLNGKTVALTGERRNSQGEFWIKIRTNEGAEGWIQESGVVISEDVQTGNYFTFGTYEQNNNLSDGTEAVDWQVLEVRDGRILVISSFGLDEKIFDADSGEDWETSSLRKWLNDDFYSSAFNVYEKARILSVPADDPTGTDSGSDNSGAEDRIFLLSAGDVTRYFGTDTTARRCKLTEYARSNSKLVQSDDKGTLNWWKPTSFSGADADILTVRPAFWMDVSDLSTSDQILIVTPTADPVLTLTPIYIPEPIRSSGSGGNSGSDSSGDEEIRNNNDSSGTKPESNSDSSNPVGVCYTSCDDSGCHEVCN